MVLDANRSKLLLNELKWIRVLIFQFCGFFHCVSVLRKTLRISVEIRTNTGAWQHCESSNSTLRFLTSETWRSRRIPTPCFFSHHRGTRSSGARAEEARDSGSSSLPSNRHRRRLGHSGNAVLLAATCTEATRVTFPCP